MAKTRITWTTDEKVKYVEDWNSSGDMEQMIDKYLENPKFATVKTDKTQMKLRLSSKVTSLRKYGFNMKKLVSVKRQKHDVKALNKRFENLFTADELKAAKEATEAAMA